MMKIHILNAKFEVCFNKINIDVIVSGEIDDVNVSLHWYILCFIFWKLALFVFCSYHTFLRLMLCNKVLI